MIIQTEREITANLIRIVLGVLDSNNQSVIRRKQLQSHGCEYTYICTGAARTYFKSRKSYHQRQASGKQAAAAASSRRCQRRHNVSKIIYLLEENYGFILIHSTESSCSFKGS